MFVWGTNGNACLGHDGPKQTEPLLQCKSLIRIATLTSLLFIGLGKQFSNIIWDKNAYMASAFYQSPNKNLNGCKKKQSLHMIEPPLGLARVSSGGVRTCFDTEMP